VSGPGEPVHPGVPTPPTPSADEGGGAADAPGAPVRRRAARRPRLAPVPGRPAVLVGVAAAVLGVGLVAVAIPPPAAVPPAPAADGLGVAPAAATSSSLFCATGAGAGAGAGATGVVVLTNTSDVDVHGVMTTVRAGAGASVRRTVVVPARGQADVIPAAGLPAGASAASFAFSGGGVSATAVVGGAAGWSAAPCPARVASQWDIPGGGTKDGLLSLSLFNPTAAVAVVDLTFLTTSGAVLVPQAYQGVTVGPGQLVTEALNDYVQDQPVVTTLVQATSGSLVATALHQPTGPAGTGLTLLAGVPAASTTWRFAQTTAVAGGSVDLVLADPATAPATVQVSAGLPSASVVPRTLSVAGRSVSLLRLSAIPGWPLGSPYSVTVRSTVPLVVGRSVAAPAGAAAPRTGAGPAVSAAARSWLVVGPGRPGHPLVAGATIASLAVADPGDVPADVLVAPLAGGPPVARLRVAPHSLAVLGPSAVGGLRPLVVTSPVPVVVEDDLGPAGAPGVVSLTGIPLSG